MNTKGENEKRLLETLARVDPDLYLIKIALMETQVNPWIIPQVIRTIGNLALGTGNGKVQIFMQARVITDIKPEETVRLNEKAVSY